MSERTYSQEIAQQIRDHLDSHEIKYDFDEEHGLINFSTKIQGVLSRLDFIFKIEDDSFAVFVKIPLDVDVTDENAVKRMNEFICRASHGLIRTSFYFDRTDGEIQCRFYINCNGIAISEEMIINSILYPSKMFKRYSKGILDTMFTDKDIQQIVDECEKPERPMFSELLSALGESEGKSEEEIISALAERFSSQESDEEADE